MRRWLFNLASAVSLVLCLAAVGLWIDSYWRCVVMEVSLCSAGRTPYHALAMISERGGVSAVLIEDDNASDGSHIHFRFREAYDYGGYGSSKSFSVDTDYFKGKKERWVVAPHWFWASPTVLLPIVWGFRSCRSSRRRGGCAACGYSLTGNTSGVCSECGSPVAEKAEAKA